MAQNKVMMRGIEGILANVRQFEVRDGEIILKFGKHSGISLKEIAENDPWYFDQLLKYNNLPLTIQYALNELEEQQGKDDDYFPLKF